MTPFKKYCLRTFRALCDSLIPETEKLGKRLGEEHRPGAASIELELQVYEAFNHLRQVDAGPLNSILPDNMNLPLSELVALLLDVTALEYMATQSLQDPLSVKITAGPFTWLSEADRRELIDYLGTDSSANTLNELLEGINPYSGFLKFLTRGISSVPLITYYSEWDGYDQQDGKLVPDPETFTGAVQSWEQTGFPGLKDGYSKHEGYEVEEFEENDF